MHCTWMTCFSLDACPTTQQRFDVPEILHLHYLESLGLVSSESFL
jgi:hypothetical protein